MFNQASNGEVVVDERFFAVGQPLYSLGNDASTVKSPRRVNTAVLTLIDLVAPKKMAKQKNKNGGGLNNVEVRIFDNEIQDGIREMRGIEKIIKTLLKAQDVELKTNTLTLLSYVVFRNKRNQDAVRDTIPLLVSFLEKTEPNVVCCFTFRAGHTPAAENILLIKNLAMFNDENKLAIRDAGGITLLETLSQNEDEAIKNMAEDALTEFRDLRQVATQNISGAPHATAFQPAPAAGATISTPLINPVTK